MAQQISDAVNVINSTMQSIDNRLADLNSSMREQRVQHGRIAVQQGRRENIIMEKLDNIQRNRKPVL